MKEYIYTSVVTFFIITFNLNVFGNCNPKFSTTINVLDSTCKFKNLSSANSTYYYWDFGDGSYIIQTEKLDITHKYKVFGKYVVTLTVEDTSKTSPCIEMYSEVVNFDTALGNCNADFSYTEAPSNPLEIKFQNISTGLYHKIWWSFGDGSYSNANDKINHIYSKAGKYKVELVVYDTVNGLKSIEKKRVKVGNPQVYADFNCVAVDSIGSSFKFINKSSSNSKSYWEFGDGSVSRKENPKYNYATPGIYKVKLTVINSSTDEIASFTEEILVKEAQSQCNAKFSEMLDLTTQKVFFVNESKCSDNTKFTWNFGDGSIENKRIVSHQYNKKGIYKVSLSIYDSTNTCNSFYTEDVHVCDSTIIANNFDYYVDSANNVSFVSNSANASSVKWFFGDIYNTTDASIIHNYNENNLYFVHLQEEFDGYNYHQSQLINVNSNDTSLACRFGVIVEDDFSKAAPPRGYTGAIRGQVSKLVWRFGDGSSDSTTLFPIHSYADTGYYNVCLTVYNQYTQKTVSYCEWVHVDLKTSINTVQSKHDFIKLYPNPAANLLNINIKTLKNSSLQFTILNILGEKIESFNEKANDELNLFKINTSNLENGIYFIRIEGFMFNNTLKFVINR